MMPDLASRTYRFREAPLRAGYLYVFSMRQ